MSLRCNIGIHQWGYWRPLRVVTKNLVTDTLGNRRPDQDYEIIEQQQKRTCRRCGMTERRAA